MEPCVKLILLCVFSCLFSCGGDDENSPDEITPTVKDVYAAGSTIKDGIGRATWWENDIENVADAGSFASSANDIWVDKTDVYLCGITNKGTNLATYWKNGTAVPLVTDVYSYAKAIVISNGDVFVAGAVMNSETNTTAATVWKNGEEQQISDAESNEFVYGMHVSNNDVYVAGIASKNGKQVATYWKNTTKVFLSDEYTVATNIFVSDNNVYVSGWENKGGVYRACYWKNGNITYLTDGTLAAEAHSIFVSGNDVYVSGRVNNIATYWKNGTPSGVFASGGFQNAYDVVVSGNDVYVGGYSGSIASYRQNATEIQLSNTLQGEVRSLFVK